MAINEKIRNEKLRYDINEEIAKILAFSSSKIDKIEYLRKEEILCSELWSKPNSKTSQIYISPLVKAFEK